MPRVPSSPTSRRWPVRRAARACFGGRDRKNTSRGITLKSLTRLHLRSGTWTIGCFTVRSKGVQERTAGGTGRIEICVEAMALVGIAHGAQVVAVPQESVDEPELGRLTSWNSSTERCRYRQCIPLGEVGVPMRGHPPGPARRRGRAIAGDGGPGRSRRRCRRSARAADVVRPASPAART